MTSKRMPWIMGLIVLLVCGVAHAAPTFRDFSLPDLDGTLISTRALREDKVLVMKLGATWCRWCQRETKELGKLRKDFDPADLAIVEVYIMEDAETVAPHVEDLPLTVVLDQDGIVADYYDVEGIPVMLVVDPTGEITYRGNYTPHAELVKQVKQALAARKDKPSPGTTAGKAQTLCPVMGGPIDKTIYADYKGQRVYFCCAGCKAQFEKDPEKFLKKMDDDGVSPEKVAVVCSNCGQIKGSSDCCKPGQELCPTCGLVKGSPGCCRIAKGSDTTVELCSNCGFIKGSPECSANCGKPKASCIKCRRVKGSLGCCKTDAELSQSGLCPKCGSKKGSADCCTRQGNELCPKCGLVKGSAGCCTVS
jgi:peroxiredoxin/YHS domain-containing protein